MSGGEGTNLNSKQRRVKKGRRHFTRYVHNYTWYTISSSFKNQKHPKAIHDLRTKPDLEPTPKPYPNRLKNFKPISVLLSVAQNHI